jgi:hypothetical protein
MAGSDAIGLHVTDFSGPKVVVAAAGGPNQMAGTAGTTAHMTPITVRRRTEERLPAVGVVLA